MKARADEIRLVLALRADEHEGDPIPAELDELVAVAVAPRKYAAGGEGYALTLTSVASAVRVLQRWRRTDVIRAIRQPRAQGYLRTVMVYRDRVLVKDSSPAETIHA